MQRSSHLAALEKRVTRRVRAIAKRIAMRMAIIVPVVVSVFAILLIASMDTVTHRAQAYGALVLAAVLAPIAAGLVVLFAFFMDKGTDAPRDAMLMGSVFITNLGVAANAIGNMVSQAGSGIASVFKSPRALLLGGLLISAAVWFDASPQTFTAVVQGVWTRIFVPGWDITAPFLNVAALLLSLLSGFWNILLYIPRELLRTQLENTESCLLEHLHAAASGVANFTALFITALTQWLNGGLWTSNLELVPAFTALQTAVVSAQQTIACECESLNFAMIFISVALGAKGANDFRHFEPKSPSDVSGDEPFDLADFIPVDAIKAEGAAVLLGPVNTPAFVSAISNATALPFTVVAQLAFRALHNREVPDFNPAFNQFVSAFVYGAAAFDQTLNGAISTAKFIFENGLATFKFKPSDIDFNAQYWPPVFTRVALTMTIPVRFAQQTIQIMMAADKWGELSTWNPLIMHNAFVSIAETDRTILTILFKDAHVPFLVRLAPAVANTELAILEWNEWLWNLVVDSVVGTTESILDRTPFWFVLRDAMAAFEPLRTSTELAGTAWGYALGYERDPLSNTIRPGAADPIGCVIMEGTILVSTSANSTLTLLVEVFTVPNLDDFLETGEALSTAGFAQFRNLARCGGLVVETLAALTSATEAPCPPVTNLGSVVTLSSYPREPWGKTCMKVGMECMLTADPDGVDEYVNTCGPLSEITFATIPPAVPPLPEGPAHCINLAARLQFAFVERCFAVHFNPQNGVCDAAYLMEELIASLVDALAGFVRLILRLLVQTNGKGASSPPPPWPEDQVATIICTTRRVMGSFTGLWLGILGEFLAPVVDFLGQNSQDQAVIREVQTIIGDFAFSTNLALPLLLNTTAAVVETIGRDIYFAAANPVQFHAKNDASETMSVLIAVEIVDGGATFIRGILETTVRVWEIPNDTTFDSLVAAFRASIEFLDAFQSLLAEIFTFVSEIMTITLDFVMLIFSGENISTAFLQSLGTEILQFLANLGQWLKGFFHELWKIVWHLMKQIPGFGHLVATFITIGCEVVQDVGNVWDSFMTWLSDIHLASWHPFKHVAERFMITKIKSCAAPVKYDIGAAIPFSATICATDLSCSATYNRGATKYCVGPTGAIVPCEDCNQTFAFAFGCNLYTGSCQCAPVPGIYKPCNGDGDCIVLTDATQFCALTDEINGPEQGVDECKYCQTNLTCATLPGHETVQQGEKVCTCPATATRWSSVPGEFGVQCSVTGANCNPTLPSLYGVGVVNLTLAVAVTGPVGVTNLALVLTDASCEPTIQARCIDTVGTFFPKTCACQTYSHVRFNPLHAPGRRLLRGEENESVATPKIFSAEATTGALRAAFAKGAATCNVAADCMQPLAICRTWDGKKRGCALCAHEFMACDTGHCSCGFEPPHIEDNFNGWWNVSLHRQPIYAGLVQAPWRGLSWCDLTMRNTVFLGTLALTLAAVSPLEGANIQYCLGHRMAAQIAGDVAMLPLPSAVFHDPVVAFEFARDMTIAGALAFVRELDGESAADFSRAQMRAGVDPSLGVALQRHWQMLFIVIARLDFTAMHNEIMEVVQRLLRDGSRTARKVGAVLSTGSHALRETSKAINPAITVARQIMAKSKAHPKLEKIVTRAMDRVTQTATTVHNDIVDPILASRRHLLSFGSWLYEEVTDCSINVGIWDTATKSSRVLIMFYGSIFPKSVAAFLRFNTTHQASVGAIPTNTNTLKGLLAIDQLEDFVGALRNGDITPETALDGVQDFFTCDIDRVMLCSANQGLVHRGKFVTLLMVLFTLFVYFVFPEFMFFAAVIWLSFGFFVLYAAYGVSPTCFPMIPTCLFMDIMDIFAYLQPARGELEIVRLTNQFVANGHSISTCDQPQYSFNTILGNIAYTWMQLDLSLGGSGGEAVPGRDNATIPGGASFFTGWFPLYNANTANDVTYRMCNYLTWVRNSGYAVIFAGVLSIWIGLFVTMSIAIAAVLYLLAFGVFMAYSLYTGAPENDPKPPPQTPPPIPQGNDLAALARRTWLTPQNMRQRHAAGDLA
jgi:hypothetical protein